MGQAEGQEVRASLTLLPAGTWDPGPCTGVSLRSGFLPKRARPSLVVTEVPVLCTAMVPAGREEGRGAACPLTGLHTKHPSRASSAPGKTREKTMPSSTATFTSFFSGC